MNFLTLVSIKYDIIVRQIYDSRAIPPQKSYISAFFLSKINWQMLVCLSQKLHIFLLQP